jgi:hypothetical protein
MVADADKCASKSEAEWKMQASSSSSSNNKGGSANGGRESDRKALKYAEKACRKADKAHGAAVETERSLANIMSGLREVRVWQIVVRGLREVGGLLAFPPPF